MDDAGKPSPPHTGDYQYSFEEFRLMYESTESVSDRKINFMRNNAQLCITIIAGQGVAGAWTYDHRDVAPIVALTLGVISLLGIVFCLYWITQLENLRTLNAAKFGVLSEMATKVVFPDYSKATIVSKNPFDREYELMQKALVRKNGTLRPKASFNESVVPASFLTFFILAALLSAYWMIKTWQA